MQLNRFKKLAKKFGCQITPVSCWINGTISRRPDILAVTRHRQHVMTIPSKMFALPNAGHRNLTNIIHPDYYECERQLYFKKFKA